MDIKDTKIISELLRESRCSLTQLSKKIAISRESLQYRLKKLEEHKIIRYSTQINIKQLGFKRTGCYISLQNNTGEFEKDFLHFLLQHKFIGSISANIGKYDFTFDIFYRNEESLKQTVFEVESFLLDKLKELFFISLPVDQQFFYHKLIGQKSRVNKKGAKKPIKVDETDLVILKELNQHSRKPLVEISPLCHLNANAIGYRIKHLRTAGVITHSTIFVNLESLSIDLYNIQIKTTNSTHHKQILAFLFEQPNVFYYYQYFGNKDWDIDVGVIVKDKRELKRFFQQIKQYFGEHIDFKEIYLIERIYKEELPEGVFEI